MLSAEEAHRFFSRRLELDVGRFFGSAQGLHLGAGLIYTNVRFPQYEPEAGLFDTVAGTVYVLTNECDVDQANDRAFNTHTLLCPIVPFDVFVATFQESEGEVGLLDFLGHLAERDIYRVLYIPHVGEALPFGGLMYLNQISSTHVSAFELDGAAPVSAVTPYGLTFIDTALENILFRPKAEPLPGQRQ
jgi:hypothetical protein